MEKGNLQCKLDKAVAKTGESLDTEKKERNQIIIGLINERGGREGGGSLE